MRRIHDFDQVYDSQKYYRRVLEAFANPGRKVDVGEFAGKMYGGRPGCLAFAMTFLDNEVSFWTDDAELAEQITALTLSREAEAGEADYLFLTGRGSGRLEQVIGLAKCGTLQDPHQSAILLLDAGEDGDGGEGGRTEELALIGPGIPDVRMVQVPALARQAVEYRQARAPEYPEGLDLVFLLPDGVLMALPRLVGERTAKEEN